MNKNLQQGQFFHGTAMVPQHMPSQIEPVTARPTWAKAAVNFPGTSSPEHAYATSDESNAWHYAEMAWNAKAGKPVVPRVFRVEPTGEHEEDPAFDDSGNSRGNFSTDRRSQAPWRVVGEVPMPPHMGSPEDWQ